MYDERHSPFEFIASKYGVYIITFIVDYDLIKVLVLGTWVITRNSALSELVESNLKKTSAIQIH